MMQDFNQYFIHRQPTRTQVAEHYHSTLEQPNLENVESMLAATRQRNYQLGTQYFRQKYGDSRQYEQMMQSMGIQPPDPGPKQRTIHDFRTTQEYGDYVRETLEKKKQEIISTVAECVLNEKSAKPTVTYNPWTDGDSKKPHKPEDKQVVEQQFLNKFEKFRQNKQKRVSPESKPQSASKPTTKRNYRQQLITKIYREIDNSGKGYIDKMQLLEYLTANKKVMAIFNIHAQTLAEQLYEHTTANQDAMTLNEMLGYFGQQPLNISQHQQHNESAVQPNDEESKLMKNCCLLSPQDMKLFEELFAEIDIHSDMLVNRKEYVAHLLNNLEVRNLLLKPAMFEPHVNRTILLYRMFDKIDEDGSVGTEQERKTKEYVSFKQFMDYFEKPASSRNKAGGYEEEVRLVKFIDSINNKTKSNLVDLPEEVVQAFEDIIKSIPHTSKTFFKTLTFIEKLRATEVYSHFKYEIARRGGESDGLEAESVEEVLDRMLKEAHEYVELPELLMYFSRRGRPVEYYRDRDEGKRKLEESIRGSKILAQQYNYLKQDENHEVLAYDSDPEVYNGSFVKRQSQKEEGFRASRLRDSTKQGKPLVASNVNNEAAASPFKNIKDTHNKSYENTSHPQFKGTFVSMMVDQNPRGTLKDRGSLKQEKIPRVHSASNQFKVTVPEPFQFDAREEQRKKAKKEDKNETSLPPKAQHTTKPRQIPKAVKQIGLFDKIQQENERRREETKRNSMMMTLANERPFSFQNRDNQKARKKTHQEREEFMFKAKPVPWYCSVDLLKKQNEEDLIRRKEKVSRMAQQSLALSKLPPRMEKNQMQKKAEKLREGGDYIRSEEQVEKRKVKDPPDFERLQKAIQEELERKKLNKKPTIAIGFDFHSGKKEKSPKHQATSAIAEQANRTGEIKVDPLEAARRIIEKEPKVRAASTRKFDQQVEKRRKEIQEHKVKEKLRNKIEPPQFVPDIKPKLMTAECIVNANPNKLNQKERQARERKKQQEETDRKKFEQWRKGIIDRAKAQPLLVDRRKQFIDLALKRDEQLDRMKKLALISATLDQNGVSGKEKDALFSKEELNLLKDYEFLKKNGKL